MRAFALLPLFFVHLVPAQDPLPHSLLWRIQASGTSAASYLYGTVHSKDDRAFQFGDSVLPALDRCAIAAGELDLSADKELGKALFTTMPGIAGRMQLAASVRSPSISTMQARQLPTASRPGL